VLKAPLVEVTSFYFSSDIAAAGRDGISKTFFNKDWNESFFQH
jgi:hypothetical protein